MPTSAPSRLTTGPRTPALPALATKPATSVSTTVPGSSPAQVMVCRRAYTFSEERSPWAAPVTVQPSMSTDIAVPSSAAVHAGPVMRSRIGLGSPWLEIPAEASTPASTTARA